MHLAAGGALAAAVSRAGGLGLIGGGYGDSTWLDQQFEAAEAQHQQILVAFYHSEYSPTVLPSVAQ